MLSGGSFVAGTLAQPYPHVAYSCCSAAQLRLGYTGATWWLAKRAPGRVVAGLRLADSCFGELPTRVRELVQGQALSHVLERVVRPPARQLVETIQADQHPLDCHRSA